MVLPYFKKSAKRKARSKTSGGWIGPKTSAAWDEVSAFMGELSRRPQRRLKMKKRKVNVKGRGR